MMNANDEESDDESIDDDEEYVPFEDEVWHGNCLSFAIDQREEEHRFLELIELYPMTVEQIKHEYNAYPLHKACYHKQYDTVVMKLIELFPMAAQHQNKDGLYPLNIACCHKQPDHVIMKLIETFPTAVSHKTKGGKALHMALSGAQSELVIRKLIEVYPMALKEKENNGLYPIYLAITYHYSMALMKYLIELDPFSIKRKAYSKYIVHTKVSMVFLASRIKVKRNNGFGNVSLILSYKV